MRPGYEVTRGELPCVKAFRLTVARQGFGEDSSFATMRAEILRHLAAWALEHPDDVLLDIHFNQYDDSQKIGAKLSPSERLLAAMDLHPRQREGGDLARVTWTCDVTVNYESGNEPLRPELFDQDAEV